MKKKLIFAFGIFLSFVGAAQQTKYNIPTLDSIIRSELSNQDSIKYLEYFTYDSIGRNQSWLLNRETKTKLSYSRKEIYSYLGNSERIDSIFTIMDKLATSTIHDWTPDITTYSYNTDLLVDSIFALYAPALYPSPTGVNNYNSYNQVSTTLDYSFPASMTSERYEYYYNDSYLLLDSMLYYSFHVMQPDQLIGKEIYKYADNKLKSYFNGITYNIEYNQWNKPIAIKYDNCIDSVKYVDYNPYSIPFIYSDKFRFEFSGFIKFPLIKKLDLPSYGRISAINTFKYISNEWVKIKQVDFYYSDDGFNKVDTVYINDTVYISGIKEKMESFLIYPNPTDGEFTVDITIKELFDLRIYNFDGKLVHFEERTHKRVFDISHLNKGVYLVQVSDRKKAIGLIKLIKQ